MTQTYAPQRQCHGKVAYFSKAAAKKTIKELEQAWGERLNAYKCPWCSDEQPRYHLGHKPSQTLKKLKKEGAQSCPQQPEQETT